MEITKSYELHLTTMAPVHIGDGTTFGTREYIYENGYYYFPELPKLYKHILNMGESFVKKYEAFLSQPVNNSRPLRLIDFLKDAQIKERSFGGYKIKETELEVDNPNNRGKISNVSAFVRDPYGLPYIPGSSLKGAIRTIIENDKSLKHRLSNINLNDNLYHNIRVSDSESINMENIIIVQKWDYQKGKDKPNPLPVFRESLKPLTRVKFTINAVGEDAINVLNSLQNISFDHYNKYYQHFLIDFPKEFIQENMQIPIYLGAGSGFWTKVKISEGDPSRHKNGRGKMKMKEKGVLKLTKAPHKSVKISGKVKQLSTNSESFYEMGKCNYLIKK